MTSISGVIDWNSATQSTQMWVSLWSWNCFLSHHFGNSIHSTERNQFLRPRSSHVWSSTAAGQLSRSQMLISGSLQKPRNRHITSVDYPQALSHSNRFTILLLGYKQDLLEALFAPIPADSFGKDTNHKLIIQSLDARVSLGYSDRHLCVVACPPASVVCSDFDAVHP